MKKEAPASKFEKKAVSFKARHLSDSFLIASQIHQASDPTRLSQQAQALRDRIPPSTLRALVMWFEKIEPNDQDHFNTMKKAQADAWELLQFLAAPHNSVSEDALTRDKIFSNFQQLQRHKKLTSQKTTAMRVLVPATCLGAFVCLGAFASLHTAAATAAYVDPNWSSMIHHGAQKWAHFVKPLVKKVLDAGVDDWMSRLIFAAGAWHFLKPNGAFTDLQSIAMTQEVKFLAESIGPNSKDNSHTLHAAIKSIPEHERILLSHFTPPALRRFLMSDDQVRARMLKRNPPLLLNEIQSIINAPHTSSIKHFFSSVRHISNAFLPPSWRSALHLDGSVLSTPQRLNRFRAPSVLPAKRLLPS